MIILLKQTYCEIILFYWYDISWFDDGHFLWTHKSVDFKL